MRSGVGIGFGVRENEGAGVAEDVAATDARGASGLVVGGARVGPVAFDGAAVGPRVGIAGRPPSVRLSSSITATTTMAAAIAMANQGRIRSKRPRVLGITPVSF